MMEINEELVRSVANVARIELVDEDIPKFIEAFEEILNLFEELKQVNTDKVSPSFHPIEKKDHVREDKPEPSLSQEDATKLAPHHKEGYIKGPRAMQ